MGTSYNTNVVTDGLISCWDAANRRSYPGTGTTWTDLAGDVKGTLINEDDDALNFNSFKGGYFGFDGTDGYVDMGSSNQILPGGRNPFTISLWLNPDADTSNSDGLYAFYQPDDDQEGSTTYAFGMLWEPSSSVETFAFFAGQRGLTGWGPLKTTGLASRDNWVGKWCCITITYNGEGTKSGHANYRFYINDVNYALTDIGGWGGTVNFNRLGNMTTGTTHAYDGYMANISIYNRALSADEVSQNYEALKPRFAPRITKSGLVGNWDAGDPECYVGGTTCKDTANGTTATFKNWDGGNQTTGEANFNSANGGYWEFDGTDQYIQCSTNSVLQPQSFSVEAWAKESTDGGEVLALPIVTWKSGGAKYPAVYTSYHVAKTPIIFLSGSDYREFNNTAVSVAGWHHVMFTYTYDDVSTSAFYVDGVSIASGYTANGTKDATDVCDIGRADTSLFYRGSIALVRIYDRPLSLAEILDNYNKTKARFGH